MTPTFRTFGEIAEGNETAIAALVDLLQTPTAPDHNPPSLKDAY